MGAWLSLSWVLLQAAAASPARLQLEPLEVEIGQPVTVTLELEHAERRRLELDPAALLADDSWIVLEGPRVLRLGSPADPGRVLTRARLVVASLEPGERPFALQALKLGDEPIRTQASTLIVRPALLEGEDAPRPARGFREPADFPGLQSLVAPALVLAALMSTGLLALVLVHLLARRRRSVPSVRAPDARQRLSALAGTREPAAARAAFFELTRLVREAVDRRLGRDLAGSTDEEWSAATPEGLLTACARADLARLLGRAERIKYGLEIPTSFAVDQALEEARALLDALEAPSAPDTAREVAA